MPDLPGAILRTLLCAALCIGTAASAEPAAGTSAAPATPAAPAAASTTQGDDRHGTFKAVQGEVTVVRDGTSTPAAVGAGVRVADRIVTGPDSAASFTLQDGTILSIGPESVLVLSSFHFDSTTREGSILVRLARGTLRMVTGLIAKLRPRQVQITTPTAVIGVRGTDFIVEERP